MVVVLLGLILVALLFPGFLRFVLGLIALGFCAALIAGGAKAQDAGPMLPKLDVDQTCLARTRLMQDRSKVQIVVNKCVSDEQEAYDALSSEWSDSPIPVRTECLRLMIENRPSEVKMYSPLLTCFESRLALWGQQHAPAQHFRP